VKIVEQEKKEWTYKK